MVRLTLAASLLASGAPLADVPRISTDLLPVHGLVSRVMEGVGSPDLLVDPGASPHGYALRPSQAAALQDADAVIWGSAMTFRPAGRAAGHACRRCHAA